MPWDQRTKRRIKLRDLDVLMAVIQCGSMAKAANQIAVSQPAVSKAISEMERTLGVQLLDRTAQGVTPTLYGKALQKWATAVFDDLRQGVNELEFLADPAVGEVRVGASEPMQGGFVPHVIDRLTRRHPRVSIHVAQLSAWMGQLHELRARTIDLQIGRLKQPFVEDDLQAEILFNDPAYLVAAAHNPLCRRRNLGLADLVDEHWSLPPPSQNVAGMLFAETFKKHGLALPKKAVVTPSIQVHCALLMTGRYLAVFPGSLLRFGTQHLPLKILPVEMAAHTPVGIATLRNRTISPVVQLFIDCAREVAKTMNPPKLGRIHNTRTRT